MLHFVCTSNILHFTTHFQPTPEWRNWLRGQIPTNVAEIDVEGIFEGSSKVVLLRLPVAIWDMLPDHDAYSFVGYVRSSNLIVKQLETALPAMPTPPSK